MMKGQLILVCTLWALMCGSSQAQTKQMPLPPLAPSDYIHKKVERMPVWPGCDQPEYTERDRKKCTDAYIRDFLAEYLVYPKLAYDNDREGMCVVTFNVRKSGKLGEIRCIKDMGLGLGEAATDVIHLMNEKEIVFTPGYENGEAQVVNYTIPVSFRKRVYDANRK